MKKSKGMNNKGFSLVELIIVMAILAILAGALAPQLIKYIDSSRKSADVQSAQTIATAVNISLANEVAYDAVMSEMESDNKVYLLSEFFSDSDTDPDPDAFGKKVKEHIGGTNHPVPKFKGTGTDTLNDFAIKFLRDDTSGDATSGNVSFEIYPANTSGLTAETGVAANQLYPTVGDNYLD